MKYLIKLKLGPQFYEVFDSAYVACQIGQIALHVIIKLEIYRDLAFRPSHSNASLA
jgi:hypothetical protein